MNGLTWILITLAVQPQNSRLKSLRIFLCNCIRINFWMKGKLNNFIAIIAKHILLIGLLKEFVLIVLYIFFIIIMIKNCFLKFDDAKGDQCDSC